MDTVARADGKDALVDSLLWDFLIDIAWMLPILVAVTVIIGVLAIRRGLAPVRAVSEQAAAIGPSATAVRLPEDDVPREIAPLDGRRQSCLGKTRTGLRDSTSVHCERGS